MAASAVWALQQSIYQALAGNAEVVDVLGGAKIFDDVPQSASFPYLTFGQSIERDWSTGSERGCEHTLTLHVWSQAGGRKQTHEIIEKVRAALNDAPITVEDHKLVNLRHEFSEARRDEDGETYHGIVRYRAVTEPA